MSLHRRRAGRLLTLALLALWLLAPTVLAAAQWPRWWTWIASEQTPMTWLQSVVLVLCAAGSLLLGHLMSVRSDRSASTWCLLAAGFGALAVDERFALHERVRDGVLAPRGITVPFLPWVAPGDFLVLGIAALGLVLLPRVWRAVRGSAGARRALVLGVVLGAVAAGVDSVDPATWSLSAERLQQSGEEVVELGSGLSLLAAVGLRLLDALHALVDPPAAAVAAAPAAGQVDAVSTAPR